MAANYARMGFVGFVKFLPIGSGLPVTIRVQNADVKLSQEISYPDLVDGKIDQTVMQLNPQQVGGNLSFPLIHDIGAAGVVQGTGDAGDCGNSTADTSFAGTLWQYATKRDQYGRMSNMFDCVIRYADNLAYTYGGCLINTMQWTINQSEPVSVSCEVIGGGTGADKLRNEYKSNEDQTTNFLAPARVITWNDARVQAWNETGVAIFDNGQIREFTASINNNIERIYALNNALAPVDIAAKKREVSGTFKTLGAIYKLSQLTETNQLRFTSNSSIAFGYALGANTGLYWATGLTGVVFEIEEVSLQTGLFETTTKWRALGDCDNKHQATYLGTGDKSVLTRPAGIDDYGGSTAPNYPQFDNYS